MSGGSAAPIGADSPARSAPRIETAAFVRVLVEAGSPWAGEAPALYELLASSEHDPAFWLAICGREHTFGTNRDSVLWRNATNSWTNARSCRTPGMPYELIRDAKRGGPYVRYRSVSDSLLDGVYRLDDPDYVYAREGRHTIGAVLARWTEDDAAGYIAYVVEMMNAWRTGSPPPRLGDGQGMRAIRGLIDIRGDLPRRPPADRVIAGPFETRPLAAKRGIVVHYSGPPVTRRDDTLAVLRAEAAYHVGKDWARAGEAPVYGDGLMYHVAIGADGATYLCRDLESVLWHCGAWPQNALALAVHLPLGGDQRATPAQLRALGDVCDDWRAATGTPLGEVWGHQELAATSCPGTLMADFVYPYRAGKGASMSDGQWFAETGYTVGGAFWEFWQRRGGLPIFGYPLTNELVEDGRTAQYFERAVMEWRPENDDPYKVLLRRLGADALAQRVSAAATSEVA